MEMEAQRATKDGDTGRDRALRLSKNAFTLLKEVRCCVLYCCGVCV